VVRPAEPLPEDEADLEMEADSRALARALAAAAVREANTGEADARGVDLVQSLHTCAVDAIRTLVEVDCTDHLAAEARVNVALSRYGMAIGALAQHVATLDQRARDGMAPADDYLASPYTVPPALLDLADG
jgi:hypothetical protein